MAGRQTGKASNPPQKFLDTRRGSPISSRSATIWTADPLHIISPLIVGLLNDFLFSTVASSRSHPLTGNIYFTTSKEGWGILHTFYSVRIRKLNMCKLELLEQNNNNNVNHCLLTIYRLVLPDPQPDEEQALPPKPDS